MINKKTNVRGGKMNTKEKLYDLIKNMPDETVYKVMLILDSSAAREESRLCDRADSTPASREHLA